ncbi:NAD(P)-dependent dehydrogenase (short-subunit alcohol dehydrogenase family) [Chryseobacterium defluvii]|uniref:NAD(P)-dependent dehydrogenase (Short-subunit alcohol dehydrogenase family) n=1 Tax=Chryseobacterium defluvii TaxID=160396 RepID=A0A840KKA5_9FLAO|nr:SDR family oxidoreductase [Chryseobacterium defluvii]MBB4807940.1 NAD(P)-dependent dehydrogenase (short-subunit alcohol dehydrogenase family) [Chryseobacterium defluvii]
MDFSDHKFTKNEWEACLKVLHALKDEPFLNPDNKTFSGLITKIHKNAKKQGRQENYLLMKAHDLDVNSGSVLMRKALAGVSAFYDEEKGNTKLTKLQIPKNCYCCNRSYQYAHSFYTRLCPKCAEENYEKRFESADLKGRNVILTGGRVKVGFATALKILRNGANLVLTTRFPALALELLQQEQDYEEWKNQLWIYGLDLRNLKAIQEFTDFYKANFDTLNILINNAAQTIKYPDEYYLPIIKREKEKLVEFKNVQNLIPNRTEISGEIRNLEYAQNEQTPVSLTRFGQPVDHRDKTSWNSTLEEISMYELVEVNLINQLAPYFLIKELKPLMKNSVFKEKFVINVTSSEGIFSYENKTMFHPHTNMTKAALNMMTLTSAREFEKEQIYMSAVDVGWISTGAKESLRKKQFEQGYIPPLDSVDGAARILHPVIEGIKGNYYSGVLLKNYKIHTW